MTGLIKRITQNFNLRIPIFGSPGWGTEMEKNFDIIDSVLYSVLGLGNVKGVWDNDTLYAVGDRAVDTTAGQVYQCLVAHTSSATGTFEQSRTTNPTYWRAVLNAAVFRGQFTAATEYNANEFVHDGVTKYGVVVEPYTSGATYGADVAAGRIYTLIDSADLIAEINAKVAEASASATSSANSAAEAMSYANSISPDGLSVLSGFRNKIINGDFDVWQRGTSLSSPAIYTADRWRLQSNGSGATRTISRQTHPLGQTDVPGNPKYFLRFDQSVAGTGGTINDIFQRIESVLPFSGQEITITGYIKASAPLSVTPITQQFFGSGGSPSASIATSHTVIPVTTSWQKFSIKTTLASVAGKTLGSNANDGLDVLFRMPSNAVQTVDLSHISLVFGDATNEADPFSPRHIAQEVALCQRYYQKGRNRFAGNVTSGYGYSWQANFGTPMRAAPTITGTSVYADNFGTTLGTISSDTYFLSETRTATATSGTPGQFVTDWQADAEI